MSDLDEKRLEGHARRKLRRQGYKLLKSRHRSGPSVGGYMIVEEASNCLVAGGHPFPYSMTLDDVLGELGNDQ